LSITKARVGGIDKDVTKTGEDRRIVLCPRAIAVLERQLQLREHAVQAGLIEHQHLFFTHSGAPIPNVKYPYWPWHSTLRRLALRYRKPYMARHTSVSWNLMIGRNPLLIAKEHGHRIVTMLTVYAAWVEGAVEADIEAIREARDPRRCRASSARRGDSTVPGSSVPVSRALKSAQRRAITVPLDRLSSGALPRWGAGVGDGLGSPLRGGEMLSRGRSLAVLNRFEGFGSGFASSASLLVANDMNTFRKYGGADGTRTTPA
jgi:hypothetical protein